MTTITCTTAPIYAAHIAAMMGSNGLGYEVAEKWLEGRVSRWYQNLVDPNSPERAAWDLLATFKKAADKVAAAEAAKNKTAALMASRKAAEERRNRSATQAARIETSKAVTSTQPHARLSAEEIESRTRALGQAEWRQQLEAKKVADEAAREQAARVAAMSGYKTKKGKGGSRKRAA